MPRARVGLRARAMLRAVTCILLPLMALMPDPGLDRLGRLTVGSALAQSEQSDRQSLVVRGNRRIEVGTILAYMQIDPETPLTAEALNNGVRRLFDTGLFSDVRVIQEGGAIVVEVTENPSINQIAFEGNDALADEDLQQIISLRPRLPFTLSAAEADAQAIIEVYRRTGRYGAKVEPVIIERPENRVDLVFEIDEGDLTGVNSIDFVGNEVFSDRRLRGVIETSESGILASFLSSDVYDPDKLELDKELLRQFYLERGYADFTVLSATAELAPDGDGFYITFTVSEGPVYAFGALDVNVSARGLNPEDFLALIPDDLSGDTYDATRVEEIANEMTDLAGQKGFAFVQVRPRPTRNTEALTVDVIFEIQEGSRIFVERIEIEGNTATLDRVIRREIDLVEGDAFDARRVREAQRNIRALDFFSSVDIEAVQGSAEDRAVLKVKVAERSTGSLSFGIGYSTSAGPIGNVRVTERNFLGRGQTVQVGVTAAGDTQLYDFLFVEPRVLDRDLSASFRAFYLDDDRSDESSFEQKRAGVTPSIGFPLGERTDLGLRYSFLHDDITVASNASPAIKADEGKRNTSLVGYRLSYDQRNDEIEPTDGYLLSLDQEVAGLGGDSRFIRTRATAKGWQGFFDNEVVASLELEAAGIYSFGPNTRVTERYFLGSDTLRGFAQEGIGPRDIRTDDALGGNYMLAARFQVSFPIGLPDELGIYGGAFVDAGTVWHLDQTVYNPPPTVIDDKLYFRMAAGGLLFIDTPFGPLELSLGVPVIDKSYDESELFRLSIGTRF
ncbi:outer membrane protein assembly factor BamA [Limibaculum sp. M0105]|uniref:Outer membrane protein assembly factor BamA n=1 Tax=Thermohalobaculum xanthum TaxID=2753746 RepID=A0A8J7M5U9_9RHOB|nr:outer membrane protein assembly factor BamA [Thermohalobaculum xanthum]MBK0398828.1 outer membrane protein assembly factor BamA [Thermohalobaculum xanthum]